MSAETALNVEKKLITENIDLWTSAIKAKKAQGRGSSFKRELYGIKKLRELILELAVRGKLVPQDPSDEPASVLLERIAVEKEQLVKDKKIKKPKKLPEISGEEQLLDLPKGWEWSQLGSVVEIIRGITFPASAKTKEAAEGRVGCLRTTNVQETTEWEDLLYIDAAFVKRDDQFVQENDILMSMANSRELVGKVSFVNSVPMGKSSFGGFLSVIRPYEVTPFYVMSFLRAPHVREKLIGSASQTTNIANISLEKLNPLAIAIPPLSEQHRIIGKVDELMALCDQLEQQTEASLDAHQLLVDTLLATLTNAQDADELSESWAHLSEHFDTLITTDYAVEQLKQTILQLAVMGKLVPQNPNDEPASELLKRIAAEKAQLIKDKKIKKQKPLPEITDEEKPFELPPGWAWTRFDDIVEIGSGVTKGRKLAGRETIFVPYLRVANVQRNELVLDEIKEIEIGADEAEKYRVQRGDLLITEGGDWDKVGRTALWRDETEYMAHQNHVFKARQIGNEHNEVWLERFLNSQFCRDYFAGSSKQTTNLASINKTQLRGTVVAIPPAAEQDRIVAFMSPLLSLCDQLKAQIGEVQTTQLQLADTVVEKVLN